VAELVDLSQEIHSQMFVYPGHLKTQVWEYASHDETRFLFEGGFSFATRGLLMSDHGPTHVDALSHLDPSPDAPAIDQMDLGLFTGPGICLDLSHAPPNSYISARDLSAAHDAATVSLEPGDVLLIHTGAHARHHGSRQYLTDYPGLDADASEWLVQRGVKIFGVDSPSPDNPLSPTYPCHMMCRRAGITHYENLANLDRLLGRRFTFAGFPLRIRGGTGSPVRAVAWLDD
jgi:kynurenine formamidase